jgi:hypothetical protein
MWRGHFRLRVVTSNITVAEVIGENQQDVRQPSFVRPDQFGPDRHRKNDQAVNHQAGCRQGSHGDSRQKSDLLNEMNNTMTATKKPGPLGWLAV